jgi:uncharacterized membrane protein
MKPYFLPWQLPVLLFFTALLALLFFLFSIQLVGLAFAKIGIHPLMALLILLASLLGAGMNVPLTILEGEPQVVPRTVRFFGIRYVVPAIERNQVVLALNMGGAVIPLILSGMLLLRAGAPWRMGLATVAVAAASYATARPVPGVGIALPLLVPPLAAVGAALLLGTRELAPAIAYVSGTVGTLVGADLLHLHQVKRLGATMVSIGGAGTFDGIFLSGIIAAALA